MTTASASSWTSTAAVRVTITANAQSLDDDAARASFAVAEWLEGCGTTNLEAARMEYAAAMNGETDSDPEDTAYGRLIVSAVAIATHHATLGWARPIATVDVDIEPR